MNDKHTLRDDFEDRLAEQALGELLGGKRPPDLSERILSAAAARPAAAKRRPRARLALAASVLAAAVLGGGYTGYRYAAKSRQVALFDSSGSVAEGVISESVARGKTMKGSNAANADLHLHSVLEDTIDAVSPSRKTPPNSLAANGGKQDSSIEFDKKNFWIDPVTHNNGKRIQFAPVTDWDRLAKLRREADEAETMTGGLPALDGPPILYPDPEEWQRLVQRRKKYKAARETKVSLNEAEIIGALGDKTELDFVDQPLTDVVDYLQERHGIEIQVHEKVLTDSGVGIDEPITKNLKGVTLRSALRQMLGELNLTYVISDKALIITSQTEAEKLNSAKVYPVGDLIIPPSSPDEGRGPGEGGDRYSRIIENPFLGAAQNPLSSFSIDVDTASYAKVRRYLLEEGALPPPDAVRIEELVNYFRYDLPQPEGEAPLTAKLEAAACPWQPKHRLLRVSLKAREIAPEARPAANLVFLLDVSGSMEPDDKLPRVRRAMRLLAEQLREPDRVAIVVYAGSSGLVLPSTSGFQKEKILSALESLSAGGSTNGGEGLTLAYEIAAASFIKGGVNRVILCTDGDFNVGVTSDGELERLIEEKARSGVFLTVLGFGMGNHNDQMLEKLADKGNGNYGYIDTEDEARKLLVEQAGGTLVTVAKDVKLQLEFNPRQVAAYRLIGYEDRLLRPEDFNDDRKDAGEIGAGHAVTALYELIPAERPAAAKDAAVIEPLKYQRPASLTDAAGNGELLSLKVKYKAPDAETSKAALEFTLRDEGQGFGKASTDFKFAAAVASFGMLLRDSEYEGDFTYDAVLEIAQEGLGADEKGYRKAFLEMVRKAKELAVAK